MTALADIRESPEHTRGVRWIAEGAAFREPSENRPRIFGLTQIGGMETLRQAELARQTTGGTCEEPRIAGRRRAGVSFFVSHDAAQTWQAFAKPLIECSGSQGDACLGRSGVIVEECECVRNGYRGRKVGSCLAPVLEDEAPTTLTVSCRQRERRSQLGEPADLSVRDDALEAPFFNGQLCQRHGATPQVERQPPRKDLPSPGDELRFQIRDSVHVRSAVRLVQRHDAPCRCGVRCEDIKCRGNPEVHDERTQCGVPCAVGGKTLPSCQWVELRVDPHRVRGIDDGEACVDRALLNVVQRDRDA